MEKYLQQQTELCLETLSLWESGLYVGSKDNFDDDDVYGRRKEEKDNPIFAALDKVKLKPQASFDSSGHSRVPSRASHESQRSNGKHEEEEEESKIVKDDVVLVLQDGLSKVSIVDTPEWNTHKHVRGDRELKPIFVPF